MVSPSNFAFLTIELFQLGTLFVLLLFVQTGLEHTHRGLLVLELRALVLALNDDIGGKVSDTNGGIGLVDMLSTFTGRAVGIYAKFILIDLYLRVVVIQFGYDINGTKGSMPPFVRVEGTDPDESMNAALTPNDRAIDAIVTER